MSCFDSTLFCKVSDYVHNNRASLVKFNLNEKCFVGGGCDNILPVLQKNAR